MNLENSFSAIRINEKSGKPILHVHASVMVYTPNPKVSLTKASPQGINPSILILDLEVIESPGPMKGVMNSVCFELSGDEVMQYDHVQINHIHGSSTIKIESPLLGNLVGRPIRIYASGESITEDFIGNRINFQLDNRTDNIITSVWFG
jgi:hypothetical protein